MKSAEEIIEAVLVNPDMIALNIRPDENRRGFVAACLVYPGGTWAKGSGETAREALNDLMAIAMRKNPNIALETRPVTITTLPGMAAMTRNRMPGV